MAYFEVMMMQNFTPSNDVELNIFTTEPSWSSAFIDTRVNVNLIQDENGDIIERPLTTNNFWKLLRFLKKDFRLGNLTFKRYDIPWFEQRMDLAERILSIRNNVFEELAVLAVAPVINSVELSHSINGFLRKYFRTFITRQEDSSSEPKSRGLFGFLKK